MSATQDCITPELQTATKWRLHSTACLMPSTFAIMEFRRLRRKPHAEAAKMFIMNELVTKEDLRMAVETLTLRLTVRMGVMFATGLTLLGAVLKLHS
jgi:hypothetical protein